MEILRGLRAGWQKREFVRRCASCHRRSASRDLGKKLCENRMNSPRVDVKHPTCSLQLSHLWHDGLQHRHVCRPSHGWNTTACSATLMLSRTSMPKPAAQRLPRCLWDLWELSRAALCMGACPCAHLFVEGTPTLGRWTRCDMMGFVP